MNEPDKNKLLFEDKNEFQNQEAPYAEGDLRLGLDKIVSLQEIKDSRSPNPVSVGWTLHDIVALEPNIL